MLRFGISSTCSRNYLLSKVICLVCTSQLPLIIFNLKLLLKIVQIPRQVGDLSLFEKFMDVKIFSFCKWLLMYNVLTGCKFWDLSVLIKACPACVFVDNFKEMGVLVSSS